jgi:hypothetical protein
MTSTSDSLHKPVNNDKVELSVCLDADLIHQVSRLTNDPSKVIEVALRQWLRSGTPLEKSGLSRVMPVNPPVPPKGEWND